METKNMNHISLHYYLKNRMQFLLMMLVFFIIAFLMLSAYGLCAICEKTQEKLENSLSPVLEVVGEKAERKLADIILRDARVSAYDYVLKQRVEAENVVAAGYPEDYSERFILLNNLQMTGNSYSHCLKIEDQTYEVLEGRFYTDQEIRDFASVVLVDERLAEKNGIRTGSFIRVFYNNSYTGGDAYHGNAVNEREKEILELQVIGIYRNNRINPFTQLQEPANPGILPENELLIPASTLFEYSQRLIQSDLEWQKTAGKPASEIVSADDIPIVSDRKEILNEIHRIRYFRLNKASDMEAVREEYGMYLDEKEEIRGNDTEYMRMKAPLDMIRMIGIISLLVCLFLSSLIIFLLSVQSLWKRRYDISLRLLLGENKGVVFLSQSLEFVLLCGISLLMATGGVRMLYERIESEVRGFLIEESGKTADVQQLTKEEEQYFSGILEEKFYEDFVLKTDGKTVFTVYGMMILSCTFGLVFTVWTIQKSSVRQLLAERE